VIFGSRPCRVVDELFAPLVEFLARFCLRFFYIRASKKVAHMLQSGLVKDGHGNKSHCRETKG